MFGTDDQTEHDASRQLPAVRELLLRRRKPHP
jgi:hypothetical protein